MVEILLSTYNGELYLFELFDSLICQTYKNWRILIRDDGSTDNTLKIIAEFQKKFPEKFKFLDDESAHLEPTQSFGCLLNSSTAPFIALCDQDDVWLPGKLAAQMKAMQKSDGSMPTLVHTDLFVCDADLKIICGSFWKYQHINPEKMKYIQCLLLQNFVTGCSILMNRALCDKILPIPDSAIIFDWWISLVALQSGTIVTVKLPLVKYRQHSTNAVGAKRYGLVSGFRTFIANYHNWRTSLLNTRSQAAALVSHLDGTVQSRMEIIIQYTHLFSQNWYIRKIQYLRLGMKKYGMIRQLLTWFLI